MQRSEMVINFIGAGEHGRWECEIHFLGGLKIDHQLILGRRLHGHLGWLLALEDAIDIFGRVPERIQQINPIGHQAAAGDERAFVVPTPVMLDFAAAQIDL